MNILILIILIINTVLCLYFVSTAIKQKKLFNKLIQVIINIENGNKNIIKSFNINEKLNKLDNSTTQTLKELELSEIFFNSVHEGIIVLNKNKKIISANRGFTNLTGYKSNDIINSEINFLGADQYAQEELNSIYTNNRTKKEIVSRKENGEIFPAIIDVNQVTDNDGDISNYVILIRDFTEEKEKEVKLIKLAKEDMLTKIPNRTAFSERLSYTINQADRENYKFALGIIDLDKFKPINDTYGHNVGDEVLIEVSKRIKNTIRKSDTVARVGGDEFVIIISPLKQKENVEIIKEKILNNLCQPFTTKEGHTIDISGSLGYVLYPDSIAKESENKEEKLYNEADKAMYEIKKNISK